MVYYRARWILVGVTIISKNNIVLKIILQAITVELILHSIEMNTELPTTFSLVYVIPFIFVAIILTSSILMLSFALILALPFMDFLNVNELSSAITTIVDVAGDSLYCARGIINNMLTNSIA